MVETGSGAVISSDLLTPKPSLEAMWGEVPAAVAERLARKDLSPSYFKVNSRLLKALLQPLAGALEVNLRKTRRLRSLDPAKEAFFEFVGH